jgi:hypothetical protein
MRGVVAAMSPASWLEYNRYKKQCEQQSSQQDSDGILNEILGSLDK